MQICAVCGEKIEGKRKDAKYCQKECALKAHRIKKLERAFESQAQQKAKRWVNCKQCGTGFYQRDFRNVFCSPSCCEDYRLEEKERLRIFNAEHAKLREFTELTITLVASCIRKGEDLSLIIAMCNWDEARFYEQLKEHEQAVERRIQTIEKVQLIGQAIV